MLMLVLSLIAMACFLAFYNWRWGVAAAIVVGLLQDPLRKMLPETPVYMVLLSAIIWMSAMASAVFLGRLQFKAFLGSFPRLAYWMQIFAFYLMIPAILSATYGRNSWQITLLGAFVYTVAFIVMVSGWHYPGTRYASQNALVFYAAVASMMLLGGPLEHLGWGQEHPVIGTSVFGHIWVTHRTGSAVYMLAGFFRSPDIMGWHASLVFMIAVIMAYRSKGVARVAWILLAVWAVLNVWLCGRRKMLAMLPVFMGCYFLLVFRFKNARHLATIGATATLILGMGWYVISSYYRDAAVEAFYLTTISDVDERIQSQGIGSVRETIRQAGFWGYGLGMSQQGVHNINAEKPRLWQESGTSKLVAELGVPGSILFLVLGGMLFLTAYHVVIRSVGDESFYITAGILAILIANVTSAVISAQIYGDPLVLFLLAFMVGLLLSSARIVREIEPDETAIPWPKRAEISA
jgi:hypothetical protein